MKVILALLFSSLWISSSASTYKVGPSREYVSPNALYLANVVQDGDTIEIDGETYIGTSALAEWKQNNLLIKGVNGRPKLDADNKYILGKGIWVLAGNNIVVENIEFFGAIVPDKNGAGIRLDGIGMSVRNCFFHDNENGILTSNPHAGDILIEYSEFANNGHGDGFSHNLYIGHVDKLTFRFNYSHHTKIGHNLKTRARINIISYNRIMDEESGNSSRLIDISNGGFSIVKGNLFMQGDNAPNKNMIGYGLEGLSSSVTSEFYFINNTLVNKRTGSCLFLDINEGTSTLLVANNIFTGSGEVYNGTIAEMKNNLIEPSISSLDFTNEAQYEYNLNSASTAIDYGIDLAPVKGYSLIPDSIYIHPTDFGIRTIENNVIDAGAYEYTSTVSLLDIPDDNFLVYPNPSSDRINIDMDASQVNKLEIYDTLGEVILTGSDTNTLNISSLTDGLYFLVVEMKNGSMLSELVIKH